MGTEWAMWANEQGVIASVGKYECYKTGHYLNLNSKAKLVYFHV